MKRMMHSSHSSTTRFYIHNLHREKFHIVHPICYDYMCVIYGSSLHFIRRERGGGAARDGKIVPVAANQHVKFVCVPNLHAFQAKI